MPGFLSEYDDTETREFGANKQWWVRVRKHLNRGAFRSAQTVLVSPVMHAKGEDTETSGEVDTVGYQDELLFAAIEEWNLTDRDGNALPLEPDEARRASIAALPQDVVEDLLTVVERPRKKAEEQKAEVKRFPGPTAPRALPRRTRSARADRVPDAAPVLG